MNGIFITGTDTGVGKSWVCGLLAGALLHQGVRVITQKWVQTGNVEESEDILLHRELGGVDVLPAALVSPYIFTLPASPHLAAATDGRCVEPAVIEAAYQQLAAQYDLVLAEGAGGALVPLTTELLTIDFAARLGLPALVVVRNGLGCVNHALLTIEALQRRSMPILGLIFTRLTPDPDDPILRDNPCIVEQISGVPVWGEIPYCPDPRHAATCVAPLAERLRAWQAEG